MQHLEPLLNSSSPAHEVFHPTQTQQLHLHPTGPLLSPAYIFQVNLWPWHYSAPTLLHQRVRQEFYSSIIWCQSKNKLSMKFQPEWCHTGLKRQEKEKSWESEVITLSVMVHQPSSETSARHQVSSLGSIIFGLWKAVKRENRFVSSMKENPARWWELLWSKIPFSQPEPQAAPPQLKGIH